MNLNHISLPVRDLDEAETFFTRDLGFVRIDRKADAILILEDGHGLTLVLATLKGANGADVAYPEGFHIGFFLDGAAAVDAAHARLARSGHEVGRPPRPIRDRYGFYFSCLGGLLLEISAER
ncbi:MAG TPA: VOC family protein [Solirubrobacter sp.]|nr:VOC family protein [Solirubrobacter sp.]